jgi:hypothetical protein
MSAYRVTFVADYFVLTTTVDVDTDTDEVIIDEANALIMRELGFSPSKRSYDVEIEEVSI